MNYKANFAILSGLISLPAYGQGPLPRSFSGTGELYTIYTNCDDQRLSEEQRRSLASDSLATAENMLIHSRCTEGAAGLCSSGLKTP
jgi:hypothetical protein